MTMVEKEADMDARINISELFKDITKYLPSKMIPAIVGIVALPIITRLFSPADYGNYVLVIATVSILSALAGWVSMSIVRFYPAYERDKKNAEFTILTIKLTFLSIFAISIVSLCILLFLHNYIFGNFYHLMGIGIFVFILTSLFSILLNLLRIKRQIKWYSGFFVWKSITSLIFGILFVTIFKLGVGGLLWGSIFSVGFALPFLWKIAVEKIQISSIRIPWKPTIEMARYSFPLVVGNLAAWILSLSDRYVLEFFRGTHEVGIYSISYQISQNSIMLLVSLFTLAFSPLSIIVWEKQGEKDSQEFIAKGTRYFLLLCIPGIIGISTLQNPILNVLSTPSYYEGAKIIPLVVLGVFFLGITQRFGAGLSFYKKTNLYMYCVIISGLLNLGLNFLLIPKYGYIAAALTTLISYAFLLFLTIIIVVYYIGNSLTSSTLLNLILGIIVGVVVYLLMLFLLKEFKPSEIRAVLDLKNRIFARKKL